MSANAYERPGLHQEWLRCTGARPRIFVCVFCCLFCCTGLRRRSVSRVRCSVRSFVFDGALAVYDDGLRGRGPSQICVEDGHVRNGIIQGDEARKDDNDGGTAATGRAAAFGRPRRRLRFFRGVAFRAGRRVRPVAELWHAGGKVWREMKSSKLFVNSVSSLTPQIKETVPVTSNIKSHRASQRQSNAARQVP